jgi:ATP-dependent Lhr-like helicase
MGKYNASAILTAMREGVFHPIVAGWFAERFGGPTEAQRHGWPAIASGGDTLIAAPTGSGKTLAAFLYCIDGLCRRAAAGALEDRTYVVYVSPLKALSHDIQHNLEAPLADLSARFAAARAVRVRVRTGDTPAAERQQHAKTPPHILVTTPESLYIVLTTERGRAALAGVETVIVDEIHALAPDRRGAHLALSLERLDALGRRRAQRIGLSATQKPIELVGRFLTGGGPCTIVDEGHARALDLEICAHGGELSAVTTHEQWGEVYDQIAALARAHRTTIVFTNTRRLCERVAHALTERLGEGKVGAHHGALARPVRLAAERRLRDGELPVMVATASLELGIDVGAVELVCQLGTPRAIATFLQRVGRAGHALAATPKGRLFAMTRDDLVECAALVSALRAGRLDALSIPDHPLDILAQQLVAACVGIDWNTDELYALVRRAYPYRDLPRADFEALLDMLADGVATRRGRSGAHLHRDRVQNRVRARRGARLAAVMSGGAIPDRNDYDVVVDPEGVKIGTLDEDFAIEAPAGSVFLLGNASWRIKRIEGNRVRVEDARGMAPTLPFWLGEGPSRTRELSEEVAALRAEVEGRLGDPALEADLTARAQLGPGLARQIIDYLTCAHAALGALPTQEIVVAERFFDEGGGMQLVIHAPFGARINRAWGLALRKSFCRSFNFELQAAATDDGIVISLGAQHSFPLELVRSFVPLRDLRDVLVQAVLQAPMFEARWRWNATRSLAVLRQTPRGKVPAALLRIRVADLMAAVFPGAAACQDNMDGPIEPPAHPLVDQTLKDCLEEWMDFPAAAEVLERLARGDIRFAARELPEPSPLAHALLNANPYAFLDDAPLEERRTRAVSVRRGLPADLASGYGALDPEAIAQVARDAAPPVRDADELHDLLTLAGAVPETEAWQPLFAELAAARRATRFGAGLWVPAERLGQALAIWGEVTLDPVITAIGPAPTRGEAVIAVVRGRLEICGPATEAELAATLRLGAADVADACARLEGEGLILRGRFRPGAQATEWCDRRLLARIHRLTLGRLRREIEPVNPGDFLRFLARWQHAAPGTQLHGSAGLLAVIAQLAGFEAAVGAWEDEIFPARVTGYDPALLDELCLSGEVMWGRRSRSQAAITTRATPIAFWLREQLPFMVGAQNEAADGPVAGALAARGALFHAELLEATRLPRAELDNGLWALVAGGRVTADGFAALRALAGAGRTRRTGRWALLAATPAPPEAVAETHARQLLHRTGVVVRELTAREELPPWRDLLVVLRRLEARGEIRGGRFVAGFVGEQFALPEAVEALRAGRNSGEPLPAPPPRDPLYIRALLPAASASATSSAGALSPASLLTCS